MIRLDFKTQHTYKNSNFVNQWLTGNTLLALIFLKKINLRERDIVINQTYII